MALGAATLGGIARGSARVKDRRLKRQTLNIQRGNLKLRGQQLEETKRENRLNRFDVRNANANKTINDFSNEQINKMVQQKPEVISKITQAYARQDAMAARTADLLGVKRPPSLVTKWQIRVNSTLTALERGGAAGRERVGEANVVAESAGVSQAAALGLGDQGFTLGQGQKRFDAQGNPIAGVPAADVAVNPVNIRMPDGSIQAFDPRDPQLKTALDAGGVEIGLNVQAGSTGELFGKKAEGELETGILDVEAGLQRLSSIQQQFKPEFLELQTKLVMGGLAQAEKLGFELSEESKEQLTEYTSFTRSAISNLNLYIKEITGAQMSEFEATRLRKGIPDPEKDSPTVFKSKLDSTTDELRAAGFRLRRLRSLGLKGPVTEAVEAEFPLSDYAVPVDEPGAVLVDVDEQGNPIFQRPDGTLFKIVNDGSPEG